MAELQDWHCKCRKCQVARLKNAAPAMLDALRLLVDTLDAEEMGEGPKAEHWVASWHTIHETARAAIATGETGEKNG